MIDRTLRQNLHRTLVVYYCNPIELLFIRSGSGWWKSWAQNQAVEAALRAHIAAEERRHQQGAQEKRNILTNSPTLSSSAGSGACSCISRLSTKRSTQQCQLRLRPRAMKRRARKRIRASKWGLFQCEATKVTTLFSLLSLGIVILLFLFRPLRTSSIICSVNVYEAIYWVFEREKREREGGRLQAHQRDRNDSSSSRLPSLPVPYPHYPDWNSNNHLTFALLEYCGPIVGVLGTLYPWTPAKSSTSLSTTKRNSNRCDGC